MKRIAAVPLWYFASLGTYFAFADLTGTPRVIGFAFAVLVAVFVATDPAHLFWPRTAQTESRASALSGSRVTAATSVIRHEG